MAINGPKGGKPIERHAFQPGNAARFLGHRAQEAQTQAANEIASAAVSADNTHIEGMRLNGGVVLLPPSPVKPQAGGVVVGRSDGDDGQDNIRALGAKQTIDNFVDSAVAARGGHGGEAGARRFQGQRLGLARTVRRTEYGLLRPGAAQRRQTLRRSAAPGGGVVDYADLRWRHIYLNSVPPSLFCHDKILHFLFPFGQSLSLVLRAGSGCPVVGDGQGGAMNNQAKNGVLYNGNAALQSEAADLFNKLNTAGSIG